METLKHWPNSPLLDPLRRQWTMIYFVSLNLPILENAYKWYHTMFVLLCLAYVTPHHVFKVQPCCSMNQNFIPSNGQIIFHCMERPHPVCPSICWWTPGFVSIYWLLCTCCCEHWHKKYQLESLLSIPSRLYLEVGSARAYGNCVFNFLRNQKDNM